MLAYYLLWQQATEFGWTQQQLDRQAELLIANAIGIEVDFEVHDAVEKLCNLKLVTRSADGRLHAVPIEPALRQLDDRWDAYFRFNLVGSMATDHADSSHNDRRRVA